MILHFDSLDWIPEKNELVTGEVGNIKFWTLEVHRTHQREILKPKLVRTIADLADEEWVQYVSYDRTEERCFAAVDTSVYVSARRTTAFVFEGSHVKQDPFRYTIGTPESD